jgi:histidyl-tRNA synthetase
LRGLSIQLNSIGDGACRPQFVKALVGYYEAHLSEVCEDDVRRLRSNPLRLLDCKQPRCQPIIEGAPRTVDFLCSACAEHFNWLKTYLSDQGLAFDLNPRMVRGLDYYTRTVFEVWPPEAGAQSSLGGGGRYDGLAEQLGGRPTPGVGFAAGLERILLSLDKQGVTCEPGDNGLAFLAPIGTDAKRELNRLADALRQRGVPTVVGTGDRSLKALLRQANSTGARWALVLGDQELSERKINLRDLHSSQQRTVPLETVLDELEA